MTVALPVTTLGTTAGECETPGVTAGVGTELAGLGVRLGGCAAGTSPSTLGGLDGAGAARLGPGVHAVSIATSNSITSRPRGMHERADVH
jgi:hypothetical protein